jgi:hypothetical protein
MDIPLPEHVAATVPIDVRAWSAPFVAPPISVQPKPILSDIGATIDRSAVPDAPVIDRLVPQFVTTVIGRIAPRGRVIVAGSVVICIVAIAVVTVVVAAGVIIIVADSRGGAPCQQ